MKGMGINMTYTDHTFVVCAYKESPYLESCIQSLKAQTVRSRVIIITSTPNDYIKNIAEIYGIPYYINEDEGGITQDWNFGYTRAKTKYITIAHQDDVYEPKYLEYAIACLEGSKKPLIFFCDYFEVRNGEKVYKNNLLKVKKLMLFPFRIRCFQKSIWVRRRVLSFGSPICCPSVTFARANLPEIVFENHFRACEDWEAWEKISKIKGDFLYSSIPLMGHRIHEESETSAIIGDNMRTQEEYEMFCKFWPKWIAKIIGKQYAKGQESNKLV